MAAILFEVLGVKSVVEFDVTTTEVHSSAAEVTEHPVEAGANVTDHIRPRLDKVTLECGITNTPLSSTGTKVFEGYRHVAALAGSMANLRLDVKTSRQTRTATIKNGFVGPTIPVLTGIVGRPATRPEVEPGLRDTNVPAAVNMRAMSFPVYLDRVREVYDVLRSLVTGGVEVTLVTELRTYQSMAITSLSSPRQKGDAILFGLDLQELRFVSSSTARVKVRKVEVAEKRLEPTKDQGPKAGYSETLPTAENDRQSIRSLLELDQPSRDVE